MTSIYVVWAGDTKVVAEDSVVTFEAIGGTISTWAEGRVAWPVRSDSEGAPTFETRTVAVEVIGTEGSWCIICDEFDHDVSTCHWSDSSDCNGSISSKT